jgi:3-oxoacyl-[acyl-carrier protein] reductase
MLQALVLGELSPRHELGAAHRASEVFPRRDAARQQLLGPMPRQHFRTPFWPCAAPDSSYVVGAIAMPGSPAAVDGRPTTTLQADGHCIDRVGRDGGWLRTLTGLKREPRAAASPTALARHAHEAARRGASLRRNAVDAPGLLSLPAMDTLELGLKGRIAIVTGGSEGLGRAAVERLARSGARVVACARRKDVLERAMEDIRKATGAELLALSADVSKAADCETVVAASVRQFGGVDILLNNAGTSSAAAFEKVGDEAWQADFDLKVMGAVRMSRLVIPHMKQRGGGRIINVTTVGGKAPRAQGLPTSVSRAAGINLTKSLANEYAADRILVNTICIGLVKSAQIARRAKDGDVEAHYRELAKRVPIGRVAEASEFGDLVAFLASDRASYITGTAINFDGGMSFTV